MTHIPVLNGAVTEAEAERPSPQPCQKGLSCESGAGHEPVPAREQLGAVRVAAGFRSFCGEVAPVIHRADAQRLDSLTEDDQLQRFVLSYTFPPSSVGETGRVGGAQGRREVGHGTYMCNYHPVYICICLYIRRMLCRILCTILQHGYRQPG